MVRFLLSTEILVSGRRGHRCLRKTATVFVLNLAAADLGNSLMHSMATVSSFNDGWQFGNAGCKFYAGMVGLFGLVSIMTLSAIAVERCLVIVPPSSKFSKPTPLFAKKDASFVAACLFELEAERRLPSLQVCIGIWFYCLALVIPPYLGWSDYVPEAFLTSCTWDFYTRTLSNRAYYIFLLFFGFVVPVSIILLSYLFIIRTFRQLKEVGETMENGNVPIRETRKRTEFRVAKIIFVLIVLFLMSWTPYTIISFIAIFGDIELITPWASAAPVVFAKASVVYNPIVYGISHPAFRYNLKRRLINILSANMSEEGKEVFPSTSSDACGLQRSNARRFSRDSSSVNTDRILSRFRSYHSEASFSDTNSNANSFKERHSRSHAERTVRFAERQQIADSSAGKRGGEGRRRRTEEDPPTDEDDYITVNCKENGEAVIRISRKKDSREGDPTPGVLDDNQLIQLLLDALKKKQDPPPENECGAGKETPFKESGGKVS
ncbi:unnamed protein product [Darwinula stevensoni]|uniref:G-protein coupled receptors family 1 profile domain-containing protein n=1 Tax=Darwinula stevensoni TaxID=69355 RepID=A0A7R8XED2_9CRUS|nr:unnamed protein product [Darwinula stevensoni]CAG0894133.1 unnamed protein product [Darwinula stevensoni]